MSKIKLSENFIKNTVKLALNEDLYPSGDITSDLIKNNKVFLQIEIFDQELSEASKFLEAYNFKLIEKGTFTHQDTVKD